MVSTDCQLFYSTIYPALTKTNPQQTSSSCCAIANLKCDGQQRITQIDYHNTTTLTGYIPPEIGQLTQLTILLLYQTNLHGTLPSSISNLTGLTQLALGGNSFVGPIPPEYGNLQQLQQFYLDENFLNGTIPDSLGHIPALQILYVNDNPNIVGPLPPSLKNLNANTTPKFVYDQSVLTTNVSSLTTTSPTASAAPVVDPSTPFPTSSIIIIVIAIVICAIGMIGFVLFRLKASKVKKLERLNSQSTAVDRQDSPLIAAPIEPFSDRDKRVSKTIEFDQIQTDRGSKAYSSLSTPIADMKDEYRKSQPPLLYDHVHDPSEMNQPRNPLDEQK
ncbi:hypothetical protein HDV01_003267, partial [Terramyces sp. JEL0728]